MEAGQVVFAALVLIFMLGFTASAAMDWVADKQQEGYFDTFSRQVNSACTSLQSNPKWGETTLSKYIVLYPYYDIRYYSKIGEEGVPVEVRQACKGDKCACLIKLKQSSREVEGVYKCFTLPSSCNYELQFGTSKKTETGWETIIVGPDENERTLRDYKGSYGTNILTTCKIEGRARRDLAETNVILYEKTSDDCVEKEEYGYK